MSYDEFEVLCRETWEDKDISQLHFDKTEKNWADF